MTYYTYVTTTIGRAVYTRRMVKGVLLDVDGTLVLSNDEHAESWVEAFGHFGYKIIYEDVRCLIGMGSDKLIPKLVPGMESESGEGKKVSEYRGKLFLNKFAPGLQPAPGSRGLVQKLKASDLKLIVASSANKNMLGPLLKAARVDDLLKEATSASEADRSKPDPDIVQAALNKIGLPSDQVLMIGDTPYDIEAAKQAGVGVVAVRCGGWKDKDLNGAAAIYDAPADILNNYESSPFA